MAGRVIMPEISRKLLGVDDESDSEEIIHVLCGVSALKLRVVEQLLKFVRCKRFLKPQA